MRTVGQYLSFQSFANRSFERRLGTRQRSSIIDKNAFLEGGKPSDLRAGSSP